MRADAALAAARTSARRTSGAVSQRRSATASTGWRARPAPRCCTTGTPLVSATAEHSRLIRVPDHRASADAPITMLSAPSATVVKPVRGPVCRIVARTDRPGNSARTFRTQADSKPVAVRSVDSSSSAHHIPCAAANASASRTGQGHQTRARCRSRPRRSASRAAHLSNLVRSPTDADSSTSTTTAGRRSASSEALVITSTATHNRFAERRRVATARFALLPWYRLDLPLTAVTPTNRRSCNDCSQQ